MVDRFGGKGVEPCVIGGPPRPSYVEVRKGSAGNSEFPDGAPNPSVLAGVRTYPIGTR